jgi:hypothetical protein
MTDTPNIDATLAERGARYGKFAAHTVISQEIQDVIRGRMGETKWLGLRADQREALQMIAHKLGRIVNGDPHYADSWTDIAGYAELVAKRLQGVEQ